MARRHRCMQPQPLAAVRRSIEEAQHLQCRMAPSVQAKGAVCKGHGSQCHPCNQCDPCSSGRYMQGAQQVPDRAISGAQAQLRQPASYMQAAAPDREAKGPNMTHSAAAATRAPCRRPFSAVLPRGP